MNSGSSTLDRATLRCMQDGIYRVTDDLAFGLAKAMLGLTCTGVKWNDTEWRHAEAVATIHGIAPLLHHHAVPGGAAAPTRWIDFLGREASRNRERIARVLDLRERLAAANRASDLSMVFLKGSDFADRLYPDASLRPMADLDVLVEPSSLARLDQTARSVGFRRIGKTLRHVMYSWQGRVEWHGRGESAENPIKLDVHCSVPGVSPRASGAFTRFAWARAVHRGAPGMRRLGLDDACLICHLLLHSSENIAARAARIVHLIDLQRMFQSRTDWTEVTGIVRTYRLGWRIYPALVMLDRYFPTTVPATLFNVAKRDASFFAKRIVRSGIGRFSLCNLADLDPWTSFAWTGGLLASGGFAVRRLSARPEPIEFPTGGLSRDEIGKLQQRRLNRLLAWIVGRGGCRSYVTRMFPRAQAASGPGDPVISP